MKKTISLILLALSGLLGSAAEVERVYVTTDRPVYLAGDAVWCALSALDKNGRFSNESAVAYLELVSTDGTACTAKIGLLEGRGAGSFRIPVTAPTGTYRLIAYLAGSRLLTVFNSTSAARVADGIEILDEAAYEALEPETTAPEGAVELSTRLRFPKNVPAVLTLHNGGPLASVSLSVYHEDEVLPARRENTPERFLKAIPASVRLSRGVPSRAGQGRPHLRHAFIGRVPFRRVYRTE